MTAKTLREMLKAIPDSCEVTIKDNRGNVSDIIAMTLISFLDGPGDQLFSTCEINTRE